MSTLPGSTPAGGTVPAVVRPQIDFFISYNHHDEEYAEWIGHWLEVARYEVRYQKRDSRPGENFILKMNDASKAARKTIMVLSAHFIDADFPQSEWAAALAQDPKGTQRKLIPVRVKDCKLEGLLKPLIYVDLLDIPSELDAVAALLDGVDEREDRPTFRHASRPRYPWVAPGL
jgi:hypothetical protein